MLDFNAAFLGFSIGCLFACGCYIGLTTFISQHKVKKNEHTKDITPHNDLPGSRTMNDTARQVQEIIKQTVAEQLKIVSETQSLTHKFENTAEKTFQQDTQNMEYVLNKQLHDYAQEITQANQQYILFLNTLKSHATTAQEDSINMIKQQTNTFFEQFEQNLTDFLNEAEQKTVSSVDLELRAARELIDTYKQQQLKLIDENAIAILEKTLSLVLSKKLTIKDQIDLVYEALEKAKIENFIV